MHYGSESCIKRIKTFESKRPKNRLALKKKSLLRFQLIKIKKNAFELKRTLLLSSLKKYTFRRWGFFTSSKSTSLFIRPQPDFELQNVCGYMIIPRETSGL